MSDMKRAVIIGMLMLSPAAMAAEKTDRTPLIERIATELDKGYVFPELGTAMAAAIRAQDAKEAYDSAADTTVLSEMISRDLQSVSHDKHLRVVSRAAPAAPEQPRQRRVPVEGAEVLPGNIGYFKVNAFPPPAAITGLLDAAMATIANTDALIVDLRGNGGGSPDSAMYLAGFFVPQPTLMATVYSRLDNSTVEMRTKEVQGPRYLDRPLYLLTNNETFSAGEAAAYHLKHVAKAITVGEATGGGAHRIRPIELDSELLLLLPFTRPINVVTKSDWEGTGVTPDIAVAPEHAREAAQLEALKKLPSTPERASIIEDIEKSSAKRN